MAETPAQTCPICKNDVAPSPRYRDYLCLDCAARAASPDGRPLAFSNTHPGGGLAARYADTLQPCESHLCQIDGIAYHADEAHFGGIVIRPAQGNV
ncbi:hypothetical protein BH10PSE15_BH10PSE15_02280 [soil metagenome]